MINHNNKLNSDENQMLQAALWYASKGFSVFPCSTLSKNPATKHGFRDATTDATQIRKWWGEGRDYNIGIPTGTVNSIVVLDIDPRNGGDEQIGGFNIPETLAVDTPGGHHLYFKLPSNGAVKSGKLDGFSGLDIKGDGGYVVAPPSIVKNKDYPSGASYDWIDFDGSFKMAKWPYKAAKKSVDNVTPISKGVSILDLEEIRSALDSLNPDMEYGEWIKVLMAVHSELPNEAGLELCDAWSANGNKYIDGDVERKWGTFSVGGGKSISTLFKMANDTGWRWEKKGPAKTVRIANAPPGVNALEATIEELEAAQLHPRCIVDKILFADVAVWTAAGGTGKTTIFLKMAIEVVLGMDVFGYKTLCPGKVIFITAEDRREQCLARARILMETMELDSSDVALVLKNLLIWDVSGEQMKLAKVNDDNVMITSLADDIVKAYAGENVSIIAFDPLVSFGASEMKVNDNEGALIVAGRRMSRSLDCTIIYIHHTGKAQFREKADDQYAGRGGSALSDGARMVVAINPWSDKDKRGPKPPRGCNLGSDDELIYLTFAKQTYAKKQGRIWLKRSGWKFEQYNEIHVDPEEELEIYMNQIERWVTSQTNSGNYYTQRDIESAKFYEDLDINRDMFRKAVTKLRASGRLVECELPKEMRHGRKQTYLCIDDSIAPKF